MKTQPDKRDAKEARQPTHEVKQLRQAGDKSRFERIGAAWQRDDGSIYIRLHGTQIVSEGFSLFPVEERR